MRRSPSETRKLITIVTASAITNFSKGKMENELIHTVKGTRMRGWIR